jgi:glutamyl-tRNA synthetase
MKVRVRFAPSPTGFLHIGGARTALFNWLFAHQQGGTFVLRIEDTDFERSSEAMVDGILQGLRWLGLKWDEGPYFQSRRLDLYRKTAERLLKSNHAYRCFCPPQPESNPKTEEQSETRSWNDAEPCRELGVEEAERRANSGEAFAIRLRTPRGEGFLQFRDLVFGSIEVLKDNVEDFVILRSDGTPTYHLSVVSDDIDMGISHIIRGVDHLLNTTKHLLIYEGLGETPPAYVHLPLILGPDKKRLSKRHGATSVMEYRKLGFLPAALRNYLALLGWNPGTDQEIFSDNELIRTFDLKRINKANAVFDQQKLEWVNAQYLSSTPAEELESEVRAVLEAEGLWDTVWEDEGRSQFLDRIRLLKSRCRRMQDFAALGRSFFTDDFEYEKEAVEKYVTVSDPGQRAALREGLRELFVSYQTLSQFDLASCEEVLRRIISERGLKAGAFIGALRVALTGRTAAPGIFEVVLALGKEKTLERIGRLLDLI